MNKGFFAPHSAPPVDLDGLTNRPESPVTLRRLENAGTENKTLRILALAAEAFGGYGGIARSTQDLLSAISRSGNYSIDILPRIAGMALGDIPPRTQQHEPRKSRILFAAHAATLALQARPQLIYCGHLYMVPLAAALARLCGAKLAVHVHGLEIWDPPTTLTRQTLERADLVLCVSQDTARRVHAATSLTPERTTVIYNTVGDRFFPQDRRLARQRRSIENQTVLLTVSRLDARQRHKGHDRVIPLLRELRSAQIRQNGRDLLYLIAGDGDDRERLQALAAAHGVSDCVHFLGRIADDHLPDLYSAADLYVMPSTGEGFGIAFVEAMCCGTPAIGLALGGAPDALCHGALGSAVLPEAFPAALAKMLAQPLPNREVLAHATRERFGRASFEARISACLAQLFAAPTEAHAK